MDTFVYDDAIAFRIWGTGDEFKDLKKVVTAIKKAGKLLEKLGATPGVSWYTVPWGQDRGGTPSTSQRIYFIVWTVDDDGQPVAGISGVGGKAEVAHAVRGQTQPGSLAALAPWTPRIFQRKQPA